MPSPVVGAGRRAGDVAVVDDGHDRVRRGVHIEARTLLAKDRRPGVVDDRDREIAGYSMSGARDRAAREVVNGDVGTLLAVDAIAALHADDLTMIVDGGVRTGTDSVVGGRADQAKIVDRAVGAGGHDIVQIDALAGLRTHGAEIVDQDGAVRQVVIDTDHIAGCRRDRATKRVFDRQIAAIGQYAVAAVDRTAVGA